MQIYAAKFIKNARALAYMKKMLYLCTQFDFVN